MKKLFRWQHAWLLLAAIFSVVSFLLPFYHGTITTRNIVQPIGIFASSHPGIFILTAALIAGCVVVIISNNDLNIQWILTIGLLLISILNIILYFKFINHFESGSGGLSLSAIFPFLIPVCIYVAARKIKRHERIAKRSAIEETIN